MTVVVSEMCYTDECKIYVHTGCTRYLLLFGFVRGRKTCTRYGEGARKGRRTGTVGKLW